MHIVRVLDQNMKLINSHYEDVKPSGAVQLDILHRYENGAFIEVKEIANEDDILKQQAAETGGNA